MCALIASNGLGTKDIGLVCMEQSSTYQIETYDPFETMKSEHASLDTVHEFYEIAKSHMLKLLKDQPSQWSQCNPHSMPRTTPNTVYPGDLLTCKSKVPCLAPTYSHLHPRSRST